MAILECVSLEATQRGIGGKWRQCLAMLSAAEAAIKSALKEIDSGDGSSASSCLYLELVMTHAGVQAVFIPSSPALWTENSSKRYKIQCHLF